MTLTLTRTPNQFVAVSSISYDIDDDVDLPTLLEQAITPLILTLGYEPASLYRCYAEASSAIVESANLVKEDF